jgi:RNA-directed DNA polymerase
MAFGKARSCHDAIGAIFLAIKSKPKFVFDADVKGAFDNISHSALLEKLHAVNAGVLLALPTFW